MPINVNRNSIMEYEVEPLLDFVPFSSIRGVCEGYREATNENGIVVFPACCAGEQVNCY